MMESKNTIAFVGMSANAAEMHHTLDPRLCDCLFVIIAIRVIAAIYIKAWVKESPFSKRFHHINHICVLESRSIENLHLP